MDSSKVPSSIRQLLKRMYAEYSESLALPQPYHYIYGNPVRPIMPLDIAQDGVFIIGAYPTAKFATIEGVQTVPVADINGPFSNERYYDGSRIRTVASGEELEEAYLTPLAISREQCWVTNLVKVFLFKKGHIEKNRSFGCVWPSRATRKDFEKFARQGLDWLAEELELARPKVILTLGAEVAGILQNVSGQKRNALLGGDVKMLHIAKIEYPVIHLAHPGITMRKATDRNPWPRLHQEEHIPAARKNIAGLLA